MVEELVHRGVECRVLAYVEAGERDAISAAVESLGIRAEWVANEDEALVEYKRAKPDWLICGNRFDGIRDLAPPTRSGLLFHGSGTGVKRAALTPDLGLFDVRFVSGPGRMALFRELYPNTELVEAGFAKLDPLCTQAGIAASRLDLGELGLEPSKPTLLYAPTFYPSSIENMSVDFPAEFKDFNVLIKAHDFTLNKSRYRHQKAKLEMFARADNVYLATDREYSLIPFLATADAMATDTSSAIFECASIDKPVLTCDFVRLRWTYRGPLRYRLRRRLDPSTRHYLGVAESVRHYQDLLPKVRQHLEQPELLGPVRRRFANELMGPLDGKSASRIADYLQGVGVAMVSGQD